MQKRPVLGAISGFFFGLFLGLTLLGFGAYALNSAMLTILPIAGLVVGLIGALWGPLARREPAHAPPPSPHSFEPGVWEPSETPAPTPSEPPPTPRPPTLDEERPTEG